MNQNFLALGLAAIVALGLTFDSAAGDGGSQPAQAGATNQTRVIDVGAAEKLIASGKVTILEVRTPQEYAAGHLAGATNLDFRADDFQTKVDHLDKNKTYLVHCASGGLSARACTAMNSLHFTDLYDLKGGLQAWQKAGKPVVK